MELETKWAPGKASVTGILSGLVHHAYSISKFAVASEPCKHGIRVNCISPLALETLGLAELYPGVEDGVGELKGAPCEEEDIAKAALYLASEEGKCVSGHNLVVGGSFTAYKSFSFA